jgi:hypothetical protein
MLRGARIFTAAMATNATPLPSSVSPALQFEVIQKFVRACIMHHAWAPYHAHLMLHRDGCRMGTCVFELRMDQPLNCRLSEISTCGPCMQDENMSDSTGIHLNASAGRSFGGSVLNQLSTRCCILAR